MLLYVKRNVKSVLVSQRDFTRRARLRYLTHPYRWAFCMELSFLYLFFVKNYDVITTVPIRSRWQVWIPGPFVLLLLQ